MLKPVFIPLFYNYNFVINVSPKFESSKHLSKGRKGGRDGVKNGKFPKIGYSLEKQ